MKGLIHFLKGYTVNFNRISSTAGKYTSRIVCHIIIHQSHFVPLMFFIPTLLTIAYTFNSQLYVGECEKKSPWNLHYIFLQSR